MRIIRLEVILRRKRAGLAIKAHVRQMTQDGLQEGTDLLKNCKGKPPVGFEAAREKVRLLLGDKVMKIVFREETLDGDWERD